MTDRSEIHLLKLESKSANAIDESVLEAIGSGMQRALAENKSAVVLTGYDKFFSAGLNLKSLPSDRAGMASFIDRFEEVMIELLRFPLPIVAAVNGHAIAGGCVLACATDYRLGATGKYKLGVSEVSLGLVFPATAFEVMRSTLAPEVVTDVLLGGKLLGPEEAQSAGILHRVVAADALLEEAFAKAAFLADAPNNAFHHTKLSLRAPLFERVEQTRQQCRKGFLDSWFSEEVAKKRRAMLD